MIIVADASPLVSLAILGKLDLLEKLFQDIYIPQAVFDEITSPDKPFAEALYQFSAEKTKKVKNKIALLILTDKLDLGEAEAIILALENNIDRILIDERKGRKIAETKGLRPIGTIGVLIQAKEKGMIASVKVFLDELVRNSIYISPKLYKHVLELTKEA